MGLRGNLRRLSNRYFPEIPIRYTPTPAEHAAVGRSQEGYSRRYQQYIEALQTRASGADPLHLSFMPIAKNIRAVGTALHRAAGSERRIAFRPGNPFEEAEFERTGRGPWDPWLWSRGMDDRDREYPWRTWFRDTADLGLQSEDAGPPEQPGGGRVSRKWRNILQLAACTDYAFRPNHRTADYVRERLMAMSWPDGQPVLGIHLRRGDATAEAVERTTRPSRSLEAVLARADMFCARYSVRTIYLSTESEQEIANARAMRPQIRILALDHNRDVFPRLADTSVFIEDQAITDPSIVEPIVLSAIADLTFLARCDAFIGTFNSEFSIAAWLLNIGRHGYVIPYADMIPRREMERFQGRLHLKLRHAL